MHDSTSLPFNATLLGGEFKLYRPGVEQVTGQGFWLLLQGTALVVRQGDERQKLLAGDLPEWADSSAEPLCIGFLHGQPLRALNLAADAIVPAEFTVEPFHGPDADLDVRLSTLAGLSNQLLHWERRSRFCSCCAAPLSPIAGTWGKRCPDCSSEHFPHIHPCIIVLVRRGDEFLLVRNANWPADRFSLIAGFLDPGESLEECVQREVQEEAGIKVENIRYVGSQNWPFPSQQMIGFVAEYAEGEVRPDGVEVADARWFTVDSLPHYPGNMRSIARWMLRKFAVAK